MQFSARSTVAAVVLIAGAACLSAGEPVAQETDLVIGLLVPAEEPQAACLREGATLGVELANHSAGPRARLVIRGRTGQWGTDGGEAARMVTDDGAMGLIAPPGGAATHLVLQVSGRTAVPVVTLCGDSSVSATGVPWMVRIAPRTAEEAETLFAGIPARRWIAVVPDGRAGREAARDVGEAATHSGCALAKLMTLSPSLTNLDRFGKNILTNRPDAVLLWLDSGAAGNLAKTLRGSGYTGALAGPGRLRSPDFASAAGDALEGFAMSAPILEPDAAGVFQRFTAAFRDRFGHDPDATAAAAYDAASLLIQVLRQSGGRPAHEAFPVKSSFAGATGILAFDSRGNRKANLELLVAHGGRFVSAGTSHDLKP